MATGERPASVRYDLLFQGLGGAALAGLDSEGRITVWSAGAESLTGMATKKAVGQPYASLFNPEDRKQGLAQAALDQARAAGVWSGEVCRIAATGRKYKALVRLDAIRDESSSLVGFVETCRDLTAELAELRRAESGRDQKETAARMEALGRLAGVAAHDFNNLLTAVMSRAELALRAMDSDRERLERMLVGVRDAAHRGAAMTRRLLGFAGRGPLDPSPADLKPLLLEVVARATDLAGPEIEVTLEAPGRLPPLEIDAQALSERLLDLASNAIDAMPDGGKLVISARPVSLEGEGVGLFGGHVLITIADTGVGMEPEVKARAVEPFFSTKGGGAGVGLGLSQAYGFARQSQGALAIASEPGRGTTVSLYLPAGDLVTEEVEPDEAGQTSVLVVEDDSQVAELTDALFRELGYQPIMARTPREALDALSRSKIDLVFSDVVMPGGLSGFELARRIRTRFPDLPILLTTGFGDALAQRDVCEFPVLNKPYRIEQLVAALDALRPGSGTAAQPN